VRGASGEENIYMYSPTRTGRSNEASEEEELYIQEREMHGARLHGAFARPLPRCLPLLVSLAQPACPWDRLL
jgi:hypothetical protein